MHVCVCGCGTVASFEFTLSDASIDGVVVCLACVCGCGAVPSFEITLSEASIDGVVACLACLCGCGAVHSFEFTSWFDLSAGVHSRPTTPNRRQSDVFAGFDDVMLMVKTGTHSFSFCSSSPEFCYSLNL